MAKEKKRPCIPWKKNHKLFDEEEVKDIWHQVIVTKVPDDNETSDDYDFTMKHQSYNDNYGVKLVNVFPLFRKS